MSILTIAEMVKETLLLVEFIYCSCGCGKTRSKYGFKNGKPRTDRPSCRYIHSHNSQKGKDCPSWKGGKTIDKDGYVCVYSPNHPYRQVNDYVLEHRLVMEKHLGRYLTPDEIVHHINGIKTDNHIENLQLMTKAEHILYHKPHKNNF